MDYRRVFTPSLRFIGLCMAVLKQVSGVTLANGPYCKYHLENGSVTGVAFSLDVRYPVRSVALNVMCSTVLLDKLRKDIRHFNVFTDFALTVQFDNKLISPASIKEKVPTAISQHLAHDVTLSILYETAEEICYLVECLDLETLIKRSKLVSAAPSALESTARPVAWSVCPENLSAPISIQQEWITAVQKLSYISEHRYRKTRTPEEHRSYIQCQLQEDAASSLGLTMEATTKLAMEYWLTPTPLPLTEHIAARFKQKQNEALFPLLNAADVRTWAASIKDKSHVSKMARLIQASQELITEGDAVTAFMSQFHQSENELAIMGLQAFHANKLPNTWIYRAGAKFTFTLAYSITLHLPDILDDIVNALSDIPFIVDLKVGSDKASRRTVVIVIHALICTRIISPITCMQAPRDAQQIYAQIMALSEPIKQKRISYERQTTEITAHESALRSKFSVQKDVEENKLMSLCGMLYNSQL